MIMVRGRRIFMLRACVILVLAMAVLSRAYTPKETYIKSIREEWGIILPATEWEVYNEAIGSSFAASRPIKTIALAARARSVAHVCPIEPAAPTTATVHSSSGIPIRSAPRRAPSTAVATV